MSNRVEQDTNVEPELTEEQEESVRELIGSAAETPEAKPPTARPSYRRPAFVVALAVILVATSVYGVRAYTFAAAHESTDDAFVDGDVVRVDPKISSHGLAVHVSDNQQGKIGLGKIAIVVRFFLAPHGYGALLSAVP